MFTLYFDSLQDSPVKRHKKHKKHKHRKHEKHEIKPNTDDPGDKSIKLKIKLGGETFQSG